jgi:hypothetical protein
VEIYISPGAADEVRRLGGRVFLWQEPVGRAWLRERSGFDRPANVEFDCHRVLTMVEICIGRPTERIRALRVERARRPFRGIRVYADGAR